MALDERGSSFGLGHGGVVTLDRASLYVYICSGVGIYDWHI